MKIISIFGHMEQEFFMRRCFELAQKGLGFVAPNPLVGAVLVNKDKIIAEGFHQEYGQAHAEVNAIQAALNNKELSNIDLQNSTLYVNLEPCSHHGKTPPCVDLILKHSIKKVVISNQDPNPAVNGSGIEKLRAHGVEVHTGILEKEGAFLNRRFFTQKIKNRPYVILKWAQSQDAFINDKSANRTKITSVEADKLVHLWRSQEQAILIGTNTAAIDNPHLTVRLIEGKQPLRVIIDKELRLKRDLHIFDKSVKTFIVNHLKAGEENGIHYLQLERGNYLVRFLLYQLYLYDIQSVLVEGGSITLQSFIDAGLWDEIRIIESPLILGDGVPVPRFPKLEMQEESLGQESIKTIYNTL